jgi:hypothetical protein
MGLIAGLSMAEMRHMYPGMIMDMYAWHAEYDAQMVTMRMKSIL